jgi:hypothetical protein
MRFLDFRAASEATERRETRDTLARVRISEINYEMYLRDVPRLDQIPNVQLIRATVDSISRLAT